MPILKEYNIDMKFIDGEAYIPCQTFSDVFLSRQQISLAFNGELFAIFSPVDTSLTVQEFIYQKWYRKKVTRSLELANYSYNELCLNLDINYGLKGFKDISSFNTYFYANGFKDRLLSQDPAVSSMALKEFISIYIDNLHSAFTLPSPYVTPQFIPQNYIGTNALNYHLQYGIHSSLFKSYFGAEQSQSKPWYKEEGDTAFLYFQTFYVSGEENMASYYSEELRKPEKEFWWVEKNDTLGLIQYAHRQITRDNSPIKNVVIDLSLNSGGHIDAGAYLLSWLVGTEGNKIRIATKDAYTKASSLTAVMGDVNLDGEFNSKDCLTSYPIKTFVVTSPVSFSCGNLVPALIKASNTSTLIGRTSGGGTCSVLPTCLADGTMFNISSPFMISTYKNGVFYDVDRGVEPDVFISDPNKFYQPKTVNDGGVSKSIFRGELIDIIKSIH